jgi:hypothetical protein
MHIRAQKTTGKNQKMLSRPVTSNHSHLILGHIRKLTLRSVNHNTKKSGAKNHFRASMTNLLSAPNLERLEIYDSDWDVLFDGIAPLESAFHKWHASIISIHLEQAYAVSSNFLLGFRRLSFFGWQSTTLEPSATKTPPLFYLPQNLHVDPLGWSHIRHPDSFCIASTTSNVQNLSIDSNVIPYDEPDLIEMQQIIQLLKTSSNVRHLTYGAWSIPNCIKKGMRDVPLAWLTY